MTNEIWVNARFLTQQKSGVQQFAIELSRELFKINPNIKFVSPHNIIHKDVAEKLNVITYGKRKGPLWEQTDLPKFLKTRKSPLLLNLANSAPLKYDNSIVTLHDLAFMENPKWFSFSFRTWYKFLIPRIVKRAKHLITVSEFSKHEIQQKLNISAKNISVVYNGLSHQLMQFKKENPSINPRKKIILTMGSTNPRKNIKPVVEAFDNLGLNDYELIIVGAENKNFAQEKINTSNKRIKQVGYLKDEELWSLYQQAELFIYPSLYEGFGIPILEACYFGCPVLVNDLSVYKEVYATFELNYTLGSKTKNYVEAIKRTLSENLPEQKLSKDFLGNYSYHNSAQQVNELITQFLPQ